MAHDRIENRLRGFFDDVIPGSDFALIDKGRSEARLRPTDTGSSDTN